MIDKNGKLFGKINIIDFIVILVLVLGAAVFAYSRVSNKNLTATAPDGELYMEFFAEEVSDFVVEKLAIGAGLYDNDAELELGEVVDFEDNDSLSYGTNSEGDSVMTTREGYRSLTIKAKVKGNESAYGMEYKGVRYGIGHSLTIRAGKTKIYMRVSDIYSLTQ